jgi:hypothetical protein
MVVEFEKRDPVNTESGWSLFFPLSLPPCLSGLTKEDHNRDARRRSGLLFPFA